MVEAGTDFPVSGELRSSKLLHVSITCSPGFQKRPWARGWAAKVCFRESNFLIENCICFLFCHLELGLKTVQYSANSSSVFRSGALASEAWAA